jgi:hypothetical protein
VTALTGLPRGLGPIGSPFQNEEHNHRVLAFSYLALLVASCWIELIFCILAIPTSHSPHHKQLPRPHTPTPLSAIIEFELHKPRLANSANSNISARCALLELMFPSFHARAGLTDQACVSFRRCPLECVMDRTPAPNDGKQDPCKLHPHPSGPESWGELNGEKRSQKNKTQAAPHHHCAAGRGWLERSAALGQRYPGSGNGASMDHLNGPMPPSIHGSQPAPPKRG